MKPTNIEKDNKEILNMYLIYPFDLYLSRSILGDNCFEYWITTIMTIHYPHLFTVCIYSDIIRLRFLSKLSTKSILEVYTDIKDQLLNRFIDFEEYELCHVLVHEIMPNIKTLTDDKK